MADIILGRKGGGGGGSPSGPAGGDLAGTFPNPTISAETPLAMSLGVTLIPAGSASTFAAGNRAAVSRVIIPKTGTLRDLAVYVTASNGNVDIGVYSTASPRARLYSSGSVACPAANAWRIIGDANLAVTRGDEYDFALANDSGAASFQRIDLSETGLQLMPTGFVEGTVPRIGYLYDSAFPLPATLAEASFLATTAHFLFLGRIE